MSKRKWHPAEFQAPKPAELIQPLRAPRMTDALPKMPVGGEETVQALDKMRKMLVEGANIGSVEQALGELRAHLTFIRSHWAMNPANVTKATNSADAKLENKHGPPVPTRVQEKRRAAREKREAEERRDSWIDAFSHF